MNYLKYYQLLGQNGWQKMILQKTKKLFPNLLLGHVLGIQTEK